MHEEPQPSSVPEKDLTQALFPNGSQTVSPLQIDQRNIDMRSGNFEVRDLNGKVLEIGLQTDNTYNLRFFNSKTGAEVAQFGQQTDGTYSLKFLSSDNKTIAQFGHQTDNTYALKFFDANGVGLAQFGQFPGGGIAVRVAKAGVEVSTATNDQLVFNSSQDIFKIVATGTFSIPGVTTPAPAASTYKMASSAGVSYNHGLGYTPAVLAYELGGFSSHIPLPYTQLFCPSGQAGGWSNVQIEVDNSTLAGGCDVMSGNTPTIGINITYTGGVVRWYLLQETSN